MRAVVCKAFDGIAALKLEDVPTPVAAAGEVVVRIHAAGVNFADVLMVAGRYQVKPPLPFIAGSEFAGEVISVGEGVRDVREGDRVMGSPLHGGGFAERIAIAAQRLWKIPAGLSYDAAAGLVIGHGTAYFGLQHRTTINPGEWVLVTGAAGGVGVAAVQIAKRLGARVIAAASSKEKLDIARGHGAEALINYTTDDIKSSVRKITGRGYDVLFDNVGGDVFDSALHASAPAARLLVIGFASGRIPSIPANYLLLKNLSLLGVGFGAKVATEPAVVQQVIDGLARLHAKEPFNFEIGGVFALEEAPKALEQLASRRSVGKLVIRP
jgi:NADPH2:quinone reductase